MKMYMHVMLVYNIDECLRTMKKGKDLGNRHTELERNFVQVVNRQHLSANYNKSVAFFAARGEEF